MASANSNIQIADLDFADIKTNFINYLKNQDTFKDYNFAGSGMSILLDVLAYNTHYNAYYLNMVANEMFLDTALQRDSVVSHAKLLNYIPRSVIAPSATIELIVYDVTESALTLPKNTNFISQAIDGINYNFVTVDSTTVNTVNNVATFNDVIIKQGNPLNYSFAVDTTANPSTTFTIPDTNIDTTTLRVSVQQSGSNTTSDVYNIASNYLELNGDSKVFFLQEGLGGNYQIYFGDGIVGNALINGNIVRVSYISTEGTAAAGANSFILLDQVSGFANTTLTSISPATTGSTRESIDSIKYQAPKSYSAQRRAVTKEDYITAIQQNNLGYAFDAVNVWSGTENVPPIYGQIFVCLKPAGAYSLTQTQKARINAEVIKPISVVTVEPTIVDPDYTYLKLSVNVIYDPTKTTLSADQLKNSVKTTISNFATKTLNTFNSTFLSSELTSSITNTDSSIITNEINVQVQKKFFPNLTVPTTYKLYYGTVLEKGMFLSGVSSSPALQFRDPSNLSTVIDSVFLEEIPSSTGGVETISILNPGFGYQSSPTVTISGDGSGATATALINTDGIIKSILVLTPGSGYTSAVASITPAANDTTGQLGAAVVNLEGQFGTLRLYYFNTKGVKTILNNIGTIDYNNGIITLDSFGPLNVDNPLGQFTVTANPVSTIISSTFNRIITVDPYDPNAIVVNVIAKT